MNLNSFEHQLTSNTILNIKPQTINDELLNGEFYFNIMLHVFILFTILHLFFKFYISKKITFIIANEFKKIITNIFKNIDIEKYNKNINNYKYSLDNFINIFNNLPQINKQINTITFLKENYNINNLEDLLNFINSDEQTLPQINNSTNTDSLFSIDSKKINDMSELFANNFNLNYYYNIFSKPESYKEKINNIVLKNIAFINIFLFIILILFTFVMIKSKILTCTGVYHIVLENCITFFFIGIIEIVFFIQIAAKFIPSQPSNIYKLLISNFKNQLYLDSGL